MINRHGIDYLSFKAKSRQEIAYEYGISVKTLYRWFIRAKLDIPNGLIDPYHVAIIYETFGIPSNIEKT